MASGSLYGAFSFDRFKHFSSNILTAQIFAEKLTILVIGQIISNTWYAEWGFTVYGKIKKIKNGGKDVPHLNQF